MPLIVPSQSEFPIYEELKEERVFIMDQSRAEHQDIRPLRIAVLVLMPAAARINTEIQFFRLLGNTPLQIEPILLRFDDFMPNTLSDRLRNFYKPIKEVQAKGLDGLIITGANLETQKDSNQELPFKEIAYYNELLDLIDWARKKVASSMYCCLASHIVLNYFYDLKRKINNKKVFGIFNHTVDRSLEEDLTRGMNDIVPAPHARWGEISTNQLESESDLNVLLSNEQAGWLIASGRNGKEVYVQGHPEYDRDSLIAEYFRDKEQGQEMPLNYFPDNDENKAPVCNWKADASVFYRNWVNFVYQTTEY